MTTDRGRSGTVRISSQYVIILGDLWGPFVFCLMLAVYAIIILKFFSVLSSATNAEDKTLLFEIVFIIVWVGAGVISVNGKLLGGKM